MTMYCRKFAFICVGHFLVTCCSFLSDLLVIFWSPIGHFMGRLKVILLNINQSAGYLFFVLVISRSSDGHLWLSAHRKLIISDEKLLTKDLLLYYSTVLNGD